jgi:hypothetical protein
MFRIPLPPQNRQHRSRPLTRRLRAIFHPVHWPQITLCKARAKVEYFPPLFAILVALTRSHHMQRRLANAIRHDFHRLVRVRVVEAQGDGSGA